MNIPETIKALASAGFTPKYWHYTRETTGNRYRNGYAVICEDRNGNVDATYFDLDDIGLVSTCLFAVEPSATRPVLSVEPSVKTRPVLSVTL